MLNTWRGKQLEPHAKLEGRIFGVDEAGRGAMAGPLSVAAVEFPWPDFERYAGKVRDSKAMSPKARAQECVLITEHCKYACVMIDAETIDRFGIQHAETEGLLQATSALAGWDHETGELLNWPDLIVCDGTPMTWGIQDMQLGKLLTARMRFMVKGDKYLPVISAASIVAKVFRDNYMQTVADSEYPCYNFATHVGYVTPLHLAKLEEYGPCPIHRKTVAPVREFIERSTSISSSS